MPQFQGKVTIGGLLALCLAVASCASMPRRSDDRAFVDGPSTIEVVGRQLYVDEDFGRVLRIVDLHTRRSRRVRLPVGSTIIDLGRDERGVVVRDLDKAWRLDDAERLVDVSSSDERLQPNGLSARGPASASVRIGDVAQPASADLYFTTSSDYAFGRRIWHQSPSGELRTVVGPWARVIGDPRQNGAPWYPKSLGSPVLDGKGVLWFLDRPRHMILKVELATGVVTFVAGGAVDTDPTDPHGLRKAGEYVDLAVDDEGTVYAADHGGQRVVRIDRATGEVETITRVGGRREPGGSDAWGAVAEPDHIICEAEARRGTAVIEVLDSEGLPLPGAEVYLLGTGSIESTTRTGSEGRALMAGLESRDIRVAVFMPGFIPAVSEFRASEGCTSTMPVVLQVGTMRSHRMF